jgi:hypothetical protein
MPKRTRLQTCIGCGGTAQLGVGVSYYVLTNPATRKLSSRGKAQIKGSLPARGYCIKCFMSLKRVRRLERAEQQQLRRRLQSEWGG